MQGTAKAKHEDVKKKKKGYQNHKMWGKRVKSIGFFFFFLRMASLVTQLVKNPSVMRETWVQSLGWEECLEKGMATHSSILAWKTPCTVWSLGSHD